MNFIMFLKLLSIVKKYKHLFEGESYKETWMKKFKFAKKYIKTNNQLPTITSKNKEIKTSGIWVAGQKSNKFIGNKELGIIWYKFINGKKYKYLFLNKVDRWKFNFYGLKKYLKDNGRFPPQKHKLTSWRANNTLALKNNIGVVTENKECNKLWTDFVNVKRNIKKRPKTK